MIEWVFLAFMFTLFVLAVRMMSQGWDAAQQLGSGKFVESTTQVTRPPHPEMTDVKPGEELMVVQFTPDEDFKRKVLTSDSNLQQSLKERINEINDPWYDEDDDDDDDGDVPALLKR
jgi:hypothetical protein